MAVTKEQVNQIYGQLLGRSGQDQYLQNWADSGMTLDEIRAGVANSPEGRQYAQSQSTSAGTAGGPTAGGTTAGGTTTGGEADPIPDSVYKPPVTTAEVNALYKQYLGRDGNPMYLQQWVDSGYDLDRLAFEIANSPEGIAYRENTSQDPGDPDPNGNGGDGGGDGGGNNESVLDAIRAQQAAYEAQQQALMDQLAAQQQAQQDMFSQYGQSAKGGTGQQGPMFSNENTGGTGIQPPPNPYGQNPYSGGYGPSPLSVAQNPYSSGYGMANQYMPQTGLLGPSGFGGYGGYSPYGGGKGGGYAPARPMMGKGRPYSTGMMRGMVPGAPDDAVRPPLPTGTTGYEDADPVADSAYGTENTGTGPMGGKDRFAMTGGPRPFFDPRNVDSSFDPASDPTPQTPKTSMPFPTPVGDVFPRQAPRFPSYGGKGGYRQPMYQRPMYQPMGGYYGGGYYR